jgi:hypothetical protein
MDLGLVREAVQFPLSTRSMKQSLSSYAVLPLSSFDCGQSLLPGVPLRRVTFLTRVPKG